MLKRVLHIFLLLTLLSDVYATHIVGGEIYYTQLNANNYNITLKLYRDCFNGQAPFDNPAYIGIYDVNNALISVINISFTGSQQLQNNNTQGCVTNPGNVCVEEAIYTQQVSLPPKIGGYNLVYQRCCRNGTIQNIYQPGSTGSTYTVHVPGSDVVLTNSSPRYTNFPPLYLCTNTPLNFDHSATDPDGDSLVYEFCDPFEGASTGLPQPTQPDPPPYSFVSFTGGYSASYPMGASPVLAINNQGLLTGTPNTQGQFVLGVCVKEYRNGVLLSTNKRDFQFNVLTCYNPVAVVPIANINGYDVDNIPIICNGYTVNFSNSSSNANSYHWDFGDPTTTADVSTLLSPTYTYPDTGLYTITLLAYNSTSNCYDTAKISIRLYPKLKSIVNTNAAPQCITNNQFDFLVGGIYNNNATFNWTFGNVATPNSSNQNIVQGVQFTTAGKHWVYLEAQQYVCKSKDSIEVTIIDEPFIISNILPPSCSGKTVSFTNTSANTTSIHWDFGDLSILSDTSNLVSPSYTYSAVGNYTVTLNLSNQGACSKTLTYPVSIASNLIVNMSHSGKYCVTDNLIDFGATGSFGSNATFNWQLPNANTTQATTQVVSNIHYATSGSFLVTLTVDDNDCSKTIADTVIIERVPVLNFGIMNASGCAPLTVSFKDSSIADATLTYLWNFGDGTTSAIANPQHTYTTASQFDVSLTIADSGACADTLSRAKVRAIQTYAPPVSVLTAKSYEENIFESSFVLVDQSIGESSCILNWGDGTIDHKLKQLTHTYIDTGKFIISRIIYNDAGCSDTSILSVRVIPEYRFFIPNSFTPNGDNFNEIFYPQVIGAREYDFWVFDRWGEIIFHTDQLENGWNGKIENKDAPIGVYIWKVFLKDVANEYRDYTGTVTLVR